MFQHSQPQHLWSSQQPNYHQPDFCKSLHTRLPGHHQQPHHQPKRHQIHRWPSRLCLQSLYVKLSSLTNKTQHRTAWCSLHRFLQPYLLSTWTTTNSLRSSSQTRRTRTQPTSSSTNPPGRNVWWIDGDITGETSPRHQPKPEGEH